MPTNTNVFKTIAYTTVILFLLLISCRKMDIVNPKVPQNSKQLTAKFFNLPTDIDPEIKKVANNLQKQKAFINNLAKFIEKNGSPRWDKTIFKVVKPSAVQLQLRGNAKTSVDSSSGQGVFLIPLQSETSGNIQSYITCYKHNDSLYTYRNYNKDSLDNVHPVNDTSKNALRNTQAVFGYFEKSINNKDSITVKSPSNEKIKNVQINFGTAGNKNGRNSSSFDFTCEITITLTVYYEWQDTSTSWEESGEYVAVGWELDITLTCTGGGGGDCGCSGTSDPSIQEPDNNYWWYYGTGWPYDNSLINDPSWGIWWTDYGGGGLTPIQLFYNTLTPIEFGFWNDPSNSIIVNALTDRLNQSNFSIDDQDFARWAIDYVINNPNIVIQDFYNQFLTPPEGPDGASDPAFWDDPTNTFTHQSLPSLAAFQANFPKRSDPLYNTAQKLYSSIGGDVYTNGYTGPLSNTCAARVSKALNYSGVTIPNIPGKTFVGSDGKYYFLGAENLNRWMRKTFGCGNPNTAIGEYLNTDCLYFSPSDIGPYGSNLPILLSGVEGIYSMVSSNANWATGHADIMTSSVGSSPTCDGGCDFNGPVRYIDVWILK